MSSKPVSIAARRKVKQPQAVAPASAPETMMVEVVVVFTVDGKPVANAPLRFEMPKPAPTENAIRLQVSLDGRMVAQALEPHVGPSTASVAAPKPGLWVPGQN